MEQKLIALFRTLAAAESQIDIARASLANSAKEAFKLIDTSGRNILSSFEISQFLEKHKVKLEQDEVRMLVQYYDILRKGKLDPESFQKGLTPRNKESSPKSSKTLEDKLIDFFAKELDLIRKTQNLRVQLIQAAQSAKVDVFKMIDKENKGEINPEDLENFVRNQGAKLSSDEIKAIFQRGDRKAHSVITPQDFEAFILPDVTKKKVLAKQPDLSIATEPEIRKPTETQSAKYAQPEIGVQNYAARPETTTNRGYVNENYSYGPRPVTNHVPTTPLTISQIMEKYDVKTKDYSNPSTAYTGYRPQAPSYSAHATDRYGYDIPKSDYIPAYPSYQERQVGLDHYENRHYENSYYTGLHESQSGPSLYRNPTADYYTPISSAKPSNLYNAPVSRYDNPPQRPERSRSMNKSLSMSTFNISSPKSAIPHGIEYQDYPTSIDYRQGSRDPLSASHYQPPSYERSRYEHSPYRPHAAYGDYRRDVGSLSPPRYEETRRVGYNGPQEGDYSYKTSYNTSDYRRRDGLNNERSLYSSGYAPGSRVYDRPAYRSGYEKEENLAFRSDMMRRSAIVPPNQALVDWGKPTSYAPQVNRQGTALYDRNQLQQKYNSLARTINIYA